MGVLGWVVLSLAGVWWGGHREQRIQANDSGGWEVPEHHAAT